MLLDCPPFQLRVCFSSCLSFTPVSVTLMSLDSLSLVFKATPQWDRPMFDGMSSLLPYHDICLTMFVVIFSALRIRLLGSDAMSPLPPPPPMEEWDQVFLPPRLHTLLDPVLKKN